MLTQLKRALRRLIPKPPAVTPEPAATAEPPIAAPVPVETIPVIGETIPAASETPAAVPTPAPPIMQDAPAPRMIVLFYAVGSKHTPCTKHPNCTCRSFQARAFETLPAADCWAAWLHGQGYSMDVFRCEFDAGLLPEKINDTQRLELAATATAVLGYRSWHGRKSIGVG